MDIQICSLLKEYKKLEEKFPNIIQFNRLILDFYVKKTIELLEKCDKSLEEIKKRDRDFTKEELVSLYTVYCVIGQETHPY